MRYSYGYTCEKKALTKDSQSRAGIILGRGGGLCQANLTMRLMRWWCTEKRAIWLKIQANG